MSGVPFQQIPQNFIPPLFFVEFNNQLAGVAGQQVQPALAIGQTLNAQPGVPVPIPTASYAKSLFGANSMLARMCAVYLSADPIGPLYALPLADATGAVAATGSITFTAASQGSGTITLAIGGQTIAVGVSAADTSATIAANVIAAINAVQGIGVTASAGATGVVDLTAVHKGALGNNITIVANPLGALAGQITPSGVTIAITPMASGATDPDLGTVAAAIGDQQFDFIFHPYAEITQLNEITLALSDNNGRWAWDRQSYGHSFSAFTAANSAAALTLLNQLNDQHTSVIYNQGSPNPPWDVVADVVGTIAPSLRNIASQPLQTLKLSTIAPAPSATWQSLSTENLLLTAGGSILRFDQYGNATIGQMVTSYKTNAFGQPDASYRYVTTMFQLMAITRQIKTALVTKFGRSILVPNGTQGNPNVPYVTPNSIRNEIAAQYRIMENNGLVVNATAMIAATVVSINATNPARADIIWRPELANGLDMLAMINQFVLNPASAA
jgi:phage tail sheath gpL-like